MFPELTRPTSQMNLQTSSTSHNSWKYLYNPFSCRKYNVSWTVTSNLGTETYRDVLIVQIQRYQQKLIKSKLNTVRLSPCGVTLCYTTSPNWPQWVRKTEQSLWWPVGNREFLNAGNWNLVSNIYKNKNKKVHVFTYMHASIYETVRLISSLRNKHCRINLCSASNIYTYQNCNKTRKLL